MRMEHESRDLDGVIDEVAQAMTQAELPRDLRPAIAARMTSRPAWTLGWRVATAAAALAVVVVTVVVVSRPGGEPQQTRRAIAEPVARPAVVAGGDHGPAAGPDVARVTHVAPRPPRPIARVARQTVAPTTPGIVEISPVAVVSLKEDDAATRAQAPPQMVLIAPIDIERVRISELGELVE